MVTSGRGLASHSGNPEPATGRVPRRLRPPAARPRSHPPGRAWERPAAEHARAPESGSCTRCSVQGLLELRELRA